jgi:hypothetical protein
MNILLNFFINAHSTNKVKKVIVHASVYISDVVNLNNIVNRENAEYLTHNIFRVDNIVNKNGKIYDNALDIYTTDNSIYTKGKGFHSDIPIKMYMNYNVCISKQLTNIIKAINTFNEKGEEEMSGFLQNGLFTGHVIDNNGVITNYKKGILVNIEPET